LHEFEDAGHLFLLTKRDESVQIIRDFFDEPEVELPTRKKRKLKKLKVPKNLQKNVAA